MPEEHAIQFDQQQRGFLQHKNTTVVSEACPLLLTFQILLLVRRHWCTRLVGSSLARDIEPQKGTTCDMVALWQNEVRTRT